MHTQEKHLHLPFAGLLLANLLLLAIQTVIHPQSLSSAIYNHASMTVAAISVDSQSVY